MRIPLTKGKYAEVDAEDYAFLSQWKWWYGAGGYAAREQSLGAVNGIHRRKTILMHRLLANAPDGMDVDHINQDKLDNRRANLRIATRSQNKANISIRKRPNPELPMGVTYNPSPRTRQPYMSRVCHQGRSYFLGNFYTVAEAASAYRAKKLELFREFAA